jgi:hypothetical protein
MNHIDELDVHWLIMHMAGRYTHVLAPHEHRKHMYGALKLVKKHWVALQNVSDWPSIDEVALYMEKRRSVYTY